MEIPKEIIEAFKKSGYSYSPLIKGSDIPEGQRLCRTELKARYQEATDYQYASYDVYNVLVYKDGERKESTAPFAEFGDHHSGEFLKLFVEWMQENFDGKCPHHNNSLQTLQDIQDSEINFQLNTFWDGGFDIVLGDEINGTIEENNFDKLQDAADWLVTAVLKHFPDSKFSKEYADKKDQ